MINETPDTLQDEEVATIQAELISAIENDRIVLPTMPEIALRVRDAANEPDITIRQLSSLIEGDPALSARLIKVANSPLVRNVQSIHDLPSAISRLGIVYSASLATGLAMEQMFQSTSDAIDRRMRDVWSHSLEVAAISSVLARHYTRLRPDQATLAGLVHQIGILPILSYVEEQDLFHDEDDSERLDKLIQAVHPEIGTLILTTWTFPKAVANVPEEHVKLTRNSESVDYADVVIVAKLQSGSETDLNWSQIPAFSKLGLDPTRDVQVAEDLSEEAAMTRSALS